MDEMPDIKQAKIKYPCDWEYRIIGPDEAALKNAVIEVMGDKKYDLSFSNISKNGKYFSLSVKTFVENEEIRNVLYAAFAKHPAIKTVL